MKRQFFKTAKRAFLSIAKLMLFLAFCTFVSFAIALPLWAAATKAPNLYTFFSLAVFAVLFLFWFIKKIKTVPMLKIFKIVLKACILCAFVFLSFHLVFSGKRFLAIPVVIAIPFAIIFINAFFQTK